MMKKIGIEINGVLRDTLGKFKQLYEQHMIGKYEIDTIEKIYDIEFSGDTEEVTKVEESNKENYFEYKIKSDITSLNLLDHFSFPSKNELYSFMYEDYTMELFGHAPSTEMTTFNSLNDFYYEFRDKHELIIISDEIGKSKPASLFFLAKFGCLFEKIIFYSEVTKDNVWDEFDIILTSNPELIKKKQNDKIIIKYQTNYNKEISCEYEISTLSEFNLLLNKILGYV